MPAAGEAQGEGLVLEPFRGIRYSSEAVPDLAMVTSPPYDIVGDEGVGRFMAVPHNVVRLILPREASGAAGWSGAESREHYRQAQEALSSWLTEGILKVDPAPAIYVYEQRVSGGGEVLQRGLIGGIGLRDEASRTVLPHEDVYPAVVHDRLSLMRATEANLEPIFLLYEGGPAGSPEGGEPEESPYHLHGRYPGQGAASRLVNAIAETRSPLVDAAAEDGITHRLWRITNQAAHQLIADDLAGRQALIADGHHRYATYRELQAECHDAGRGPGPWDHGLALLVDALAYPPRLGAIHRVLPGLSLDVAVQQASGAFDTTPVRNGLGAGLDALAAAGRDGGAFLLASGGRLVLLSRPDPAQVDKSMPGTRSQSWQKLDTSVLHEVLIRHLWGIDEDQTTVRVIHHDAEAAIDRADKANGIAVILNPLKVPDVLAVAAAGEKVPRKSTSFGPKPRSGFVLRSFT